MYTHFVGIPCYVFPVVHFVHSPHSTASPCVTSFEPDLANLM